MRQTEVMDHRARGDVVAQARGHPAQLVALLNDDLGLVDGQPDVHAVQCIEDRGRIVGEPRGAVAVLPPTAVLQHLWQVPMEQGGDGIDAALLEAVDQAPVEVEAALVHRPSALRQNPRPGDGEPVALRPQTLQQVQIRLPAAIVVAGDLPRAAVVDGSGSGAEGVPDRRATAVDAHRALDLVRRSGHAEAEIIGKRHSAGRRFLSRFASTGESYRSESRGSQ